jgi:hypothetical protein
VVNPANVVDRDDRSPSGDAPTNCNIAEMIQQTNVTERRRDTVRPLYATTREVLALPLIPIFPMSSLLWRNVHLNLAGTGLSNEQESRATRSSLWAA